MYTESANEVLGYRTGKSKVWISGESWKKVEERWNLKAKLEGAMSERVNARVGKEYRQKDQEVKRGMRNDKRQFINDIADDSERALNSGQMKEAYGIVKKMCNEPFRNMNIVKSKDEEVLSKEQDINRRWREHFEEI